jgi:acetyl-CoA carboxylase biotin carboxyl carrier protein
VADEKHDSPRPFDVRTVEYLLKLMTEHDLAEVDLKEGDQRIRLRKGSALAPSFLPSSSTFTHTAGGAPPPPPARPPSGATPGTPGRAARAR